MDERLQKHHLGCTHPWGDSVEFCSVSAGESLAAVLSYMYALALQLHCLK